MRLGVSIVYHAPATINFLGYFLLSTSYFLLRIGYTILGVNKYYENIRFDIFIHKTYDNRNIL